MTTLKSGVVTVADETGKTQKLFVQGGFADVNAAGFTILAQQATPLAELDLAKIDTELKEAREDFSDAKTEEARQSANERIQQLQEMRAAIAG